MCGNFGLLLLQSGIDANKNIKNTFVKPEETLDDLDASMRASLHEVSRLNGLKVAGSKKLSSSRHSAARDAALNTSSRDTFLNRIAKFSFQVDNNDLDKSHSLIDKNRDKSFHSVIEDGEFEDQDISNKLLDPLRILESQTAMTEIRGGQAGGLSSLEFRAQSHQDPRHSDPKMVRVRCVARKRIPLAADLAALYKSKGKKFAKNSTVSFIGHTRFATASINRVPELHPHEWVPFHTEEVWQFNGHLGDFEKINAQVGIHLSHNGDFDAMIAYKQIMVVSEVGLWLERVLHTPNSTNGDSPKIVGCMDLFRVQGRWAAACRLAYVRAVCKTNTDVSDGVQLSKKAPNTFPAFSYFNTIGQVFSKVWESHRNNIIKVTPQMDSQMRYKYCIDKAGEKQFIEDILANHISQFSGHWTDLETKAFVNSTVRGFLRFDLYNALTEFLSRAEGSFGLQVHCTLEPGVVCIASKGQPMSVSYHPLRSLVLFGSEAEAVAVPIDDFGQWLPERIDLDSHGEIMRIGNPRPLLEGSFFGKLQRRNNKTHLDKKLRRSVLRSLSIQQASSGLLDYSEAQGAAKGSLLLDCGVEFRSYSLRTCVEATSDELITRSITIVSAPVPYDPSVDLIEQDLRVTPAVIEAIDHAWDNKKSVEYITADALCRRLVACMKRRIAERLDSTDLLIGGVEASLWVAEQWATDLRSVFPQLNIITVSANKLLGLGKNNPANVYFSGSDTVMERRITDNTCVLLISQSGQTFPTLHATRRLANMVTDRLWILTGCFQSKMELAIKEAYQAKNLSYGRNRVFNNYSGNRPAEPTSVAIVSTIHTLTRLMLHLVDVTRTLNAKGRIIHSWEYQHALNILIRMVRRKVERIRQRGWLGASYRLPKSPIPSKEDLDKRLKILTKSDDKRIVMNLTDRCIKDMNSLVRSCTIPGISHIVGYDVYGKKLPDSEMKTHEALVNQGKVWGQHISEPWSVLVLVGLYLIISVGLNLPLIGLISDLALLIIKSAGVEMNYESYGFSGRYPSHNTGTGWTLYGLLIQMIDAVWFIFIGKIITWVLRVNSGRPLFARMGKRTLVIVDTPCNHQLLEVFVSKMFALSYGFVSIDVHGASGLDHFVHRFTHRVVRGVMLAVGRPDGRLCCLSKSESAVFLSLKQAAFIQNIDLGTSGAGPDIVTVGHNPYTPFLSDCNCITLRSDTRGKFVDELLYERLFLAMKPFANGILKQLSRNKPKKFVQRASEVYRDVRPMATYGSQHIDPAIESSDTFLEFYMNCKELLTKKRLESSDTGQLIEKNSDPAVRLAFCSRLDSTAQEVIDHQMTIQHFYEARIASLERYVAFCVMFHSMAKLSSRPWLCTGWDMARSQSNLRVATTSCPIHASDEGDEETNPDIFIKEKHLAKHISGYCSYF